MAFFRLIYVYIGSTVWTRDNNGILFTLPGPDDVCMYPNRYIYIYIYVCVYICMYIYIYVCMYIYIYVCMYICTTKWCFVIPALKLFMGI